MKKALKFIVVLAAIALVAVALVVFAPTAKAQGRRFDNSNFGIALNRTMDLPSRDLTGLLGRRLCENHYGTGGPSGGQLVLRRVVRQQRAVRGVQPHVRPWASGAPR